MCHVGRVIAQIRGCVGMWSNLTRKVDYRDNVICWREIILVLNRRGNQIVVLGKSLVFPL